MSCAKRMPILSEQVKCTLECFTLLTNSTVLGLTKLCEDITEVLMELRYETLELDPPA